MHHLHGWFAASPKTSPLSRVIIWYGWKKYVKNTEKTVGSYNYIYSSLLFYIILLFDCKNINDIFSIWPICWHLWVLLIWLQLWALHVHKPLAQLTSACEPSQWWQQKLTKHIKNIQITVIYCNDLCCALLPNCTQARTGFRRFFHVSLRLCYTTTLLRCGGIL